MHLLLPWLALSLAGLGNCGFWLFCFNRVNAFGYPRPVAKLLEKVCIGLCFSIPLVVAWYDWPALRSWWEIGGAWPVESRAAQALALLELAESVAAGPTVAGTRAGCGRLLICRIRKVNCSTCIGYCQRVRRPTARRSGGRGCR